MFKVAYIIGDLNIGGWPTYLINLTSELRDKFEFHFIATENPNINPRFHELGKARYFGNNHAGILKYLSSHNPHIVQFGNQDFGKLAHDTGVPVIIERTAGPRSCSNSHDYVNHIIASNNGTVNLISKNFNGPITVIKNGVNVDYYKTIIKDRLGFSDSDIIVCYCARIGGIGQGHETLIKAVIKAKEKNDNIKLVFIGDKPSHSSEDVRPKLRKLAGPLGADCIWLGELNNPLPVMAGSDLYVCPALHHGISNSLIEAAALGLPIIATDVGQTNEIVFDNVSGYLINTNDTDSMADKIVKLADSPEKRKRLGSEGMNIVSKEFNIKTQAQKHLDLYLSLISKS